MGKGDGGRISRLKKASSKSFSYLMVLPAVLLFTLFAVYPFVEGIKLGFYRWDGLSPMTFIGMENYVNILHDEQYWSALKNTFLYAVVTTIAKNLLGLVLAMVMMKITHGKGFFRTITYMPVTFSYVVCGILWLWIFNPNFGLLNNFLRLIGADGLVMGWLSDSRIAIYSVMGWISGGGQASIWCCTLRGCRPFQKIIMRRRILTARAFSRNFSASRFRSSTV